MNIIIRPATRADYPAIVAIGRSATTDYVKSVADLEVGDQLRPSGVIARKLVAETPDKQLIGVATYGQSAPSVDPQRFNVWFFVLPQWQGCGIGKQLYEQVMAELAAYRPGCLETGVRTDLPRAVRFLTERGFVTVSSECETHLDLTTFNPDRFAADHRQVEQQGILLQTLAELSADPARNSKLYELHRRRQAEAMETGPLAAFAEWNERFWQLPRLLLAGFCVAVADEQYVGQSNALATGVPGELEYGYTGVLPAYRNQGIARAMKLVVLRWAKAAGYTLVAPLGTAATSQCYGSTNTLGLPCSHQSCGCTNSLSNRRPTSNEQRGITMNFDERDLYTGLAALHWSTISATDSRWDQAFYQRIIQQQGGRALELGCGAGRLLLAYLQAGLDVEGVDLSSEMLAVCREHATALGLQPVLYEQPMQALATPQQYRTIYIPCGSFVCVMDRALALQTLQGCHAHLEPGGVLAFNIYLAEYDYSRQTPPEPFPRPWKLRAEKQLPNGRRLIVSHRITAVDPVEQIEQEERRYELYDGEQLLASEIHSGQTRWYFRNELLWMLQLAGFADVVVKGDYTDEPFNASHSTTMVFLATK